MKIINGGIASSLKFDGRLNDWFLIKQSMLYTGCQKHTESFCNLIFGVSFLSVKNGEVSQVIVTDISG